MKLGEMDIAVFPLLEENDLEASEFWDAMQEPIFLVDLLNSNADAETAAFVAQASEDDGLQKRAAQEHDTYHGLRDKIQDAKDVDTLIFLVQDALTGEMQLAAAEKALEFPLTLEQVEAIFEGFSWSMISSHHAVVEKLHLRQDIISGMVARVEGAHTFVEAWGLRKEVHSEEMRVAAMEKAMQFILDTADFESEASGTEMNSPIRRIVFGRHDELLLPRLNTADTTSTCTGLGRIAKTAEFRMKALLKGAELCKSQKDAELLVELEPELGDLRIYGRLDPNVRAKIARTIGEKLEAYLRPRLDVAHNDVEQLKTLLAYTGESNARKSLPIRCEIIRLLAAHYQVPAT